MKNKISVQLVTILFAAIFLASYFIVRSSDKFPVHFYGEVVHEGYASSPAHYEVQISPEYAWEKSTEQAGGQKIFGWVCLVAGLGWCFVVSANIINPKNSARAVIPLAAFFLVGLLFFYSAYSGTFSNNKVSVTPEKYNQIKDNSDSLKTLFDSRQLIR